VPEVEYTTEVSAPLSEVWEFAREMDNWAPFLTGYQSHEKLNEDESIWVVKGELGGLTRQAEFKVHVTDWAGPERVTFTMEGLEEPVTGGGCFEAQDLATGQGAPTPRPIELPPSPALMLCVVCIFV
jgi:carbon monoxide dehydrogenase subunit G